MHFYYYLFYMNYKREYSTIYALFILVQHRCFTLLNLSLHLQNPTFFLTSPFPSQKSTRGSTTQIKPSLVDLYHHTFTSFVVHKHVITPFPSHFPNISRNSMYFSSTKHRTLFCSFPNSKCIISYSIKLEKAPPKTMYSHRV